MNTLTRVIATAAFVIIIVCAGCSKTQSGVQADTALASSGLPKGDQHSMQIYYLEIVTKEVDAVCGAYTAANGVKFSEPDAALGNARTAPMAGGGLVGVRAPMRETEAPVVRDRKSVV
jgi:hypothetical protein